jgi:hypothetical protein
MTLHSSAPWLDDPEAFRVGMAAIHDGVASQIDAIEAAMTGAGELDGPAQQLPWAGEDLVFRLPSFN